MKLRRAQGQRDTLAVSIESKNSTIRDLQKSVEIVRELRDALEQTQKYLEEKDQELAEMRERVENMKKLEKVTEIEQDRIAELEQERLLLAIDVGNLRNQLTRAEADNHFLSGTVRQLHQIMARKNLSMHALGISNAHIKEVFRICSRIEEARKGSSSPSRPGDVSTSLPGPPSEDHVLPGTPRGIFLSPRSRARLRRNGGFRDGKQ